MLRKQELFQRRRKRTRARLHKLSSGRPRLSVFRSGKHIYAQVIDDKQGAVITAASSLEKEARSEMKNGANKQAAGRVGKTIAERTLAAGVKEVVFDRGAREAG